MTVPTVAVKRKVVRYLINCTQPPRDFWEYAVTSSWLDAVQAETSHTTQDTSHVAQDTSVMERSSAESFAFISTEGQETGNPTEILPIPPLSMSEDDRLNTYVPESHWKIMTMWFGVDPNNQLRRRPISNQYLFIDGAPNSDRILCDKELDFIPIWIASMNNLVEDKKQHILSVFVWENLNHIFRQVKVVLGAKQNRKLRFWMRLQEDGHDIVWEPLVDTGETLISKLCSHLPELAGLMARRQTQINERYLTGSDVDALNDTPFDIRRPLMDEWFCDKIRSVSIGVEEVGLDLSRHDPKDVVPNAVEDSDDQLESIVTLSSIKNEWDDVLASYIEDYTGNLTAKTSAMRIDLIAAAKDVVGQKLDELTDIRSDYQRRFTQLEAREAVVDAKEREFKQNDEDLQTRLQTFKKGLSDFQKQKQKYEDDVKRIEDRNKIASSRVTLNVGGYVYTTSLDTLTRETESLFAVLFSGRQVTKPEPDGSYFIDRDGVHFRYILNYLRDGTSAIEAVPDNLKLMKELLMEARYYRLPLLEDALVSKLGRGVTDATFEDRHHADAFISV